MFLGISMLKHFLVFFIKCIIFSISFMTFSFLAIFLEDLSIALKVLSSNLISLALFSFRYCETADPVIPSLNAMFFCVNPFLTNDLDISLLIAGSRYQTSISCG